MVVRGLLVLKINIPMLVLHFWLGTVQTSSVNLMVFVTMIVVEIVRLYANLRRTHFYHEEEPVGAIL